MSWCPKCNTEYRGGSTICADCGGGLVAEESTTLAGVIAAVRRWWPPVENTGIALLIGGPLLASCSAAATAFYDWLSPDMGLLSARLGALVIAAALAGFVTGMILSMFIRATHVYAAGTIVGVVLFLLAARPLGEFRPSAPELAGMLARFLVLPQLAATLAGSWGISLAKKARGRYLLYLTGFILLTFSASLLMHNAIRSALSR